MNHKIIDILATVPKDILIKCVEQLIKKKSRTESRTESKTETKMD